MRGPGRFSRAGRPLMAVKVSVTVCLIPEAKGGPFVLWDDLLASVRLAASLGYDAVELFPPEPDALAPQTVLDLLAPHRLTVSAVGSGAGWGRDKLALTHPAEALTVLGEHAANQGQVLLYEPLNRYETNLLNTIADGVAFLETLPTTNVKLLADLFHMNIEEADIAGAIRAGAAHIG